MTLTKGITATPIRRNADGSWTVTDANTGKSWTYKLYRTATLRRRAINGRTSMSQAAGLPL